MEKCTWKTRVSERMHSCSPVSPQLLHHVLHFFTPLCWAQLSDSFRCELGHIHLSKLLQSESPSVEARAKPNGTDYRVNLRKIHVISCVMSSFFPLTTIRAHKLCVHVLHHYVPHWSTLILSVGGDDNVDVLHNTLKCLEKLIWLQLQLKQGAVHLVHHQNRLDAFGDGLPQYSLSLHTHTCQQRGAGEPKWKVAVWEGGYEVMGLPETQSTTTRAPSVTLRAAVTSEEKSTWPGESIRLMRKPFPSIHCLMNAKSFSPSS